nr:reverse transcriptase domain-containing protein [Tanacetum cinerariifolium]
MKDTMLKLVKICQEKEFPCIHDDVDDLIESALNSKRILINSNSQHLDKKEEVVKNVVEQPAERGNRNIQSLQNFRVVHKNSISLNSISQISSVHAVKENQEKDKIRSKPDKKGSCMRTRRSYFPSTATIPRRSSKQTTNVVEPEIRTIVEMADNRTMAQMLQAPIEGYEDVIVVPPINANNFELKQTLINLVQSNQFVGIKDPHNHLRFFNKVTSTFRHPEVSNTMIKLLVFPFSLEGEARIWLDKEPPRSILTWEDLVLTHGHNNATML